MEISDYIAAIRRRIWVPIVLPLVAAMVTAGALATRPIQYQSQATVIVPSLSAKGYSTSAVTQYFSTYKDVLASSPLLDEVAQQLHLNRASLTGAFTASTVSASSNIIEVTYTGPVKKTGPAIVRTGAVDALNMLVGPQLAAANSAVGSSQTLLNSANKGMSDFIVKTGLIDPSQEYRLKELELSQLMVQLEEAKLAGDTPRAAGLQSIIVARQQDLAKMATTVQEYQQLSDARSAAESNHNHALQTLSDVQAMISSNDSPSAVVARAIGHVSRIPSMVKFAGVAGAVALLLALAYIVLMEVIRPEPYILRKPIQPGLTAVELDHARVAAD